jgi:hypothetical protein
MRLTEHYLRGPGTKNEAYDTPQVFHTLAIPARIRRVVHVREQLGELLFEVGFVGVLARREDRKDCLSTHGLGGRLGLLALCVLVSVEHLGVPGLAAGRSLSGFAALIPSGLACGQPARQLTQHGQAASGRSLNASTRAARRTSRRAPPGPQGLPRMRARSAIQRRCFAHARPLGGRRGRWPPVTRGKPRRAQRRVGEGRQCLGS